MALVFAQRAACTDCGDSTPYVKPHPASLPYATGLIGVTPAHTLHVGNDERDMQAAHAAGLRGMVAA